MVDPSAKSSRLELLKIRLSQQPKGFTSKELSTYLGVPQRTILRDINTLEGSPHWVGIERIEGKYRLADDYKLSTYLTRHEKC